MINDDDRYNRDDVTHSMFDTIDSREDTGVTPCLKSIK